MFNIPAIELAIANKASSPFTHCVVDEFFLPGIAEQLAEEFPSYYSDKWLFYNNPIENKKTINDWTQFPALTYSAFSMLCSPEAGELFSGLVDEPIIPDYGLHGGGWHIHGNGGNLNPHLDYHQHPKLGLKRKVNLIIYLTDPGCGNLGLWSGNDCPEELVKEIPPKKNRAIIFDTEGSWHGLTGKMECDKGIYRKSLAIYYLAEDKVDGRKRALFAPRKDQENDSSIKEFCKQRSQ